MTKVSSKLAASVSKARRPATATATTAATASDKPADLRNAALPPKGIQTAAPARKANTSKPASELHPDRVWPD